MRKTCLLVLFGTAALITLSAQTSTLHLEFREQIIALSEDSRILKAMAFVQDDADRALEELIELTEIPAPPFEEEVRAKHFVKMITEIGVDSAWIDEVGNVIALRRGTTGKRTVVLDGHMDTVFPKETDVTVRFVGDTLFAPGISDDTRALAMLLSILRAMNSEGIETQDDILFVGSVGEEGLGDLRGVKHLFRENARPIDSWISIDGGAIGRISNQGLGSYRYRVTFKGPGGHSWGAFGMANPHHALGMAIDNFVDAAHAFTSSGLRTSYNIGRIGGGTSINSIPFESWMEVDMRSVSPERLDSLDAIFKMAMNKAVHQQNALSSLGDSLTVVIDKIGDRPSGELSPELPLIQRAMACSAYFGKRPTLNRGSTNSNIPIALGIPAVTIGRGGLGGAAHSLDEWWIEKDAYKSTQLALLLLVSESGYVSD